MKWLLNAQSYLCSSVCRHCAMAGFCHPTEGAMATPPFETERGVFASDGTRGAIWAKRGVAEV